MKVESGDGEGVAMRVGLLIASGAIWAVCSAGNLFCMPAKGSQRVSKDDESAGLAKIRAVRSMRASPRLPAEWLVWALAGLAVMGSLPPVWAQDVPSTDPEGKSGPASNPDPERPAMEKPESMEKAEPDTGLEPEGPPQEPRFLPPRLRPKVLTPEEHEEAKRLRALAAKYGTDPTAIVGRVQLSSQYADLPQGGRLSDTVARVDLPFRGNWLLRTDIPFLRGSDSNRPGVSSESGQGDLAVVAGWRAYNTPEYAFFIGAVSTFPTADENTLGFGKYTVGPFIATGRFLPRWESFLFGVFQHQVSVGGDPARADVELTRAVAAINTIWAERWWTLVQGAWQVDWERRAKSSMTLEFEVGRNVVGSLGMFVRPGVGVWGQDGIGAYDWNIEVGIRRTFASF